MGLSDIWNFLSRKKPDTLDFYIINAFTGRGGNAIGNPAAICIVDEFLSDTVMGEMAKTLAVAMTSFLRKTAKDGVYEVRHFSPDGYENHICGHASVAAGEHLAERYPEFRKGKEVTLLLNPKYKINPSNSMKVCISADDISLTLPAALELQEVQDENFYKALTDALNISEECIVKPVYFAPRINNYLVVFKNQDDLISLKPDFKKLNDISLNNSHDVIVPFWCLTAKSDDSSYDILNRVFSPDIGVDEDPACGSANCSIVPYWSLKDKIYFDSGKTDFKVLYPYPPGEKGFIGGVQDIKIDIPHEEITITAQASFKKIVTLEIPAEKRRKPSQKKSGPKY